MYLRKFEYWHCTTFLKFFFFLFVNNRSEGVLCTLFCNNIEASEEQEAHHPKKRVHINFYNASIKKFIF